jgi:hypothetical protein
MKVRIRGGTVNHGEPSLCLTCRNATIVKGRTLRDEIVSCNRIRHGNALITFPVTSCTSYWDSRVPTLWQMEEIAWVLRSNPSRKTVGFVEARRLKEDDRHVLDEG